MLETLITIFSLLDHLVHLGCLSGHLVFPDVWVATSNFFFFFFWHNCSNLSNCLSSVLRCLDSLLRLMNFMHSSMVLSSKQFFSWSIHVSFCFYNMLIVLFIDLILSLSKDLSAPLIIYKPPGVLMLLFNLMLTGITSWFKHLSENLLWFWKSAILHSIFFHHQNNLTFSITYSDLICICRFLIQSDLI